MTRIYDEETGKTIIIERSEDNISVVVYLEDSPHNGLVLDKGLWRQIAFVIIGATDPRLDK